MISFVLSLQIFKHSLNCISFYCPQNWAYFLSTGQCREQSSSILLRVLPLKIYQEQSANQVHLKFGAVESLVREVIMFVGQYVMLHHTAETVVPIKTDFWHHRIAVHFEGLITSLLELDLINS
jgi:hypothetical protein